MKKLLIRQVSVLKTTAIGGVVFLLPLIVVGVVVGQVVPILLTIASWLNEMFAFDSPAGYLLLLGIAVAVLLLLCFGAGILARWTIGKRIGGFVEQNVTWLFPKYSIYKDQLAGVFEGETLQGRMKPVFVDACGITRLALEIERTPDGVVTLYFPGSPDPWSGTTGFAASGRVRPAEGNLGDVLAAFERIGRGAATLSGIAARDLV